MRRLAMPSPLQSEANLARFPESLVLSAVALFLRLAGNVVCRRGRQLASTIQRSASVCCGREW